MFDTKLLVQGAWRDAEGAKTFQRSRSSAGSPATSAADAALADVDAIGKAAASAQANWANTGPNARRKLLNAAADRLEAHRDEFIRRMQAEVGATVGWAGFNVMLGAGILREAASATTHITGDIVPSDVPGSFAMAQRKPLGPVLGIAPWNAPVILAVRAVAMPLACGNAAVLKGSEQCPATHALVCEVLNDAGFPEGTIGYLTHDASNAEEVVGAMIEHPAIRSVNFTGSTAVGRKIAVRAAQALKPVLLELGGKAPLLVLQDADIDKAVDGAAFSAFMNQGQICMSAERIIVEQSIADTFVERFVQKVASIQASSVSAEHNTVLGEVVHHQAIDRVKALVEDAKDKGAVIHGGGVSSETVMQPTVVDHVTPDMRLYYEESFGPVVSVIRAADEGAAIAIANDTEFGLSSAVFSTDLERAMAVADQLESGICHINGPTVHDEAQMPFGGVKSSGFGRFGGKAGIEAFTQLRWTTVQRGPRHYPF